MLFLTGKLDLIENAKATRDQLAAFERIPIPTRRNPEDTLFVDLSGVETLDPCSLLYIVAQVDRLGTNRVRVSGNFPKSPDALQLLTDAGFHRYLNAKNPSRAQLQPRKPVLEISRGTISRRLDPAIWAKLHEFLMAEGHLDEDQADSVYQAFGECIENVLQHAFKRRRDGKWFALAIRARDDLPARAIVLDLGIGISATLRRPAWERHWQAVAKALGEALRLAGLTESAESEAEVQTLLSRIRSDEWFCVFMATLGLRTQTRNRKRGTGLTGLRAAALAASTGAFHVLSGGAVVTWVQGVEPQRNELASLQGTLVCLEYRPIGNNPDEQLPEESPEP